MDFYKFYMNTDKSIFWKNNIKIAKSQCFFKLADGQKQMGVLASSGVRRR